MSDITRDLAGEVSVHEDSNAVAQAVATWLRELSERAARDAGRFTVALAGGGIAEQVHRALASEPFRSSVRWDAWHVYFGDERACPPDDEASNFHMAKVSLLDHVPVDPATVHRMPADRDDLDHAAAEYAHVLEETLPPATSGAPRFDCILLGLGENGHTASLFPGTTALDVVDTWATRGRADYAPYDRMTVTFPTINAAANIAFCVTGASKREALRRTAHREAVASRVRPDGTLRWFLDRAAAG